MSKFIDSLLDKMKLNEDEDEFEDDFEEEYEEEPQEKKSFRAGRKAKDVEEDAFAEEKPAPFRIKRQANVVPMKGRGMEVTMIRPNSVEEEREICETLLSGRAVVINLEGKNYDVAQRIIDFVSGACFAMNGNLRKISDFIFIATPSSVELSGDFHELVDGSLTNAATFNIQF